MSLGLSMLGRLKRGLQACSASLREVWSPGFSRLVIGHFSPAALILVIVLLALLPTSARAAANFVYHEQSTRSALEDSSSNDCVSAQPYVEVLSPTSGQAYGLRFRVEYHGQTD